MKPTLADLSPRYQAQVAAQLYAMPRPRTVAIQVAELTRRPLRRIRQDSSGMNKTERAFESLLKGGSEFKHDAVSAQSITLKIGNGVRYTPDFLAVDVTQSGAYLLHAYEVKGFMRDDAAVKLKVAASLYPWIKFHLISKRKGGGWDHQDILP